MVMHKEKLAEGDPHYWVMAKVCEPDYAAELKFLKAEIAFVERKLDGPWPAYTDKLSVPVLGILGRNDWLKYHRKLHHYGERLEVYSEEVEAGVVPLKFAVYNASEHADHHIAIRVRVEDGRIDDKKKAPVRPERIDGSGNCSNTTGTWAAISDAALKTDIADYTQGLASLVQLQPRTFHYTFQPEDEHFGLVAQEVEPFFPEIVGEVEGGADGESQTVKTVDPGQLIYACINAIKELKAEIDALKAARDA